nr:hypothetical protein [uncultured Agathobacter sp.]
MLKGCFFGTETLAVGRGKKEKNVMTKHCLYATINSKHYISVSGTT